MSSNAAPHLLIIVNTSRFFMSHRLLLAQGAKRHGYQVTVASPNDLEAQKIKLLGFTHHPLNMGRKSMNPFNEIVTVWHFVQTLKKLKPDVVHLFTVKPVLYGALAARLVGIRKIVVTITGLGFLFLKQGLVGHVLRQFVGLFYKLIIRTPRIKVIFQNHDDYKLFTERHWVHPSQAHIIFGTGVDMDRFHPVTKNNKTIQILFPARFLKDKGLLELIEAGQILKTQNLQFQLLLCGDIDSGNPSSISADELKSIESHSFVKNLGYTEDMPGAFAQADIVCLPSYREGIPLSLLEATACGLPIVTTDVPGCREVVKHGENGYLVPARDANLLAKHLAHLITDQTLRQRMGAKGRERAVQNYSIAIVVKQNLDCYH